MNKIILILFIVSVSIIASAEINYDLFVAAGEGDMVKVNSLIDSGADPNTKQEFQATPLMVASHGGHIEIVKLLLSAKADVNATTFNGMTALMYATVKNNIQIVELLVKNGADVNIQTSTKKNTALKIARDKGFRKIVKLLENAVAK